MRYIWSTVVRVAVMAALATTSVGVAATAAATPTGVVLIAPSVPVWEDRTVTFTGTVTDSMELPVPPAAVQLWARVPGGPWSPIGSPSTVDTDGAFTSAVAWPSPGHVEVVARAAGVESSPVSVTIGDRRVIVTQQPTSRRLLVDQVTAAGRVVPAEPGVPVIVSWTGPAATVRERPLTTGPDGTFRTVLPTQKHQGKLTVRVRTGSGAAAETGGPSSTSLIAAYVVRRSPVTRSMVASTYRKGCPVGPRQLTALRMTYRDYAGRIQWGDMVVATVGIEPITAAFRRGFNTGFRIHHMSTMERYRGSDPAAMRDNNTSGFNCRRVTGNPFALSPHAYGTAVDVNTVQNPYQDSAGRWWPSRNVWTDRSRFHPGLIRSSTPLRQEFGRRGFTWGGAWSHPDWQHFDPRGRLGPRQLMRTTADSPAHSAAPAPGRVEQSPTSALDALGVLCASRPPAGVAAVSAVRWGAVDRSGRPVHRLRLVPAAGAATSLRGWLAGCRAGIRVTRGPVAVTVTVTT